MDIDNIISTYQRAYNSAVQRRDMRRAQFYGERLTQWIQAQDRGGILDDGHMTAFAIGRS